MMIEIISLTGVGKVDLNVKNSTVCSILLYKLSQNNYLNSVTFYLYFSFIYSNIKSETFKSFKWMPNELNLENSRTLKLS